MKKKSLFLALGLLISTIGLVGCGGNDNTSVDSNVVSSQQASSLNLVAGDKIYNNKVVYDRSKEAYNVGVKLSLEDGVYVTAVKLGRYSAETNEFAYKDGVLALSGSYLSKLSTQEKDMTISLSNGKSMKVSALIATKVITTAEEFQAINDNLNGIYVLGNDIDLSSISNFEPLGWYYSETDTSNAYFHGILEGNGYTVKNAKVHYNGTTTDNNMGVYNGASTFTNDAHKCGDNIGLFQVIGSSGVVRNVVFDNISVYGRTICGVIAGNVMGTVENCVVTSSCEVKGGTHFYDDDCNIGGAFGIVAGSGNVSNCVSETINVSFPDVYTDYDDTYVGKLGNGWDHVSTPDNTDPSWKYANVDKPLMSYDEAGTASDSGSKAKDSNGSNTNGIYSFAGKTWGACTNCYSATWKQTPYEGATRQVYFSQTHVGTNKPSSGSTNLGTLTSCNAISLSDLKIADYYSAYDTNVWKIEDGSLPTLKAPQLSYTIAE